MTSRLLNRNEAADYTTVFARMLGKAVKFRHCPATVSALPAGFVLLAEILQQAIRSTRSGP